MKSIFSRSWEITKLSFSIIRKDKKLLLFPLLSIVSSIIFILAILFPTIITGFIQGISPGAYSFIEYAILFATYLGLAFIATFFNVCVVYTAKATFENKPTTFGSSIKFAVSRIHVIFLWSVVAATVGLILRMLEQIAEKLGTAGKLILGVLHYLFGMAWSIITVFVVPGMVYNNLSPFKAIKQSVTTLRKTWGESLIRYFGMGFIQFLLILLGLIISGIVIGVTVFVFGIIPGIYGTLAITGVVLLYFLLILLIFSVANTVFNTALYVYADTGKVPGDYSREIMDNAFRNREMKLFGIKEKTADKKMVAVKESPKGKVEEPQQKPEIAPKPSFFANITASIKDKFKKELKEKTIAAKASPKAAKEIKPQEKAEPQAAKPSVFAKLNVFKKKPKEVEPEKPEKKEAKEAPEKKEAKEEKKSIFSFFKRKPKGQELTRLEYYKKKSREEQKKRLAKHQRRHNFDMYLDKAGISISPKRLAKYIFNLAIAINLGVSAYLIYFFSTNLGITYSTIALSIVTLWVLVFIIVLFLLWMFFYFLIDLKIFKRKVKIEDVFPDFLQLTSSNIKSGMTVDRALWYAVRPRFGVLAKEIEDVAKQTMTGTELKEALQKFAVKYESKVIKRSISLLLEGLESGGEIGSLLNRIALDIQDQKLLFKDMAASVTTYAIFIAFATIIAAPFLFALAGSLITVISGISESLGDVGTVASTGLPLSFGGGGGITFRDFRIFALFSLVMGSTMSAMLVATIMKGNIKQGIKYIPIFIIASLTIYLVASQGAQYLIGLVF